MKMAHILLNRSEKMEKKIAKVLIIMLEGRLNRAKAFFYNQGMQRECDLLRGEIEALDRYINPDAYAEVGSTNNIFP